jgi:hypothetical protein
MGANSHEERRFLEVDITVFRMSPARLRRLRTGLREFLFAIHILNDKNTAISDFSLLGMRNDPAAREAFAGEKNHLGRPFG